MIDMLMKDACAANEHHSHLLVWAQAACLYSFVWGVGGALNTPSMELFDSFYKDIWKGKFK